VKFTTSRFVAIVIGSVLVAELLCAWHRRRSARAAAIAIAVIDTLLRVANSSLIFVPPLVVPDLVVFSATVAAGRLGSNN